MRKRGLKARGRVTRPGRRARAKRGERRRPQGRRGPQEAPRERSQDAGVPCSVSGQLEDDAEPAELLQAFQQFEQGQGEKKDEAVSQGAKEEGGSDGEFRLIAPQTEIRKETRRPEAVPFIGRAKGAGEEALLPFDDRPEDPPAGQGEHKADGQAARHGADAERSEERRVGKGGRPGGTGRRATEKRSRKAG